MTSSEKVVTPVKTVVQRFFQRFGITGFLLEVIPLKNEAGMTTLRYIVAGAITGKRWKDLYKWI